MIFAFLPLWAFFLGCPAQPSNVQTADFTQVDSLPANAVFLTLPAELNEISSITWVKDHWVAVQDELGTLYHISPQSGEITNRSAFRPNGDFEGVQFVGDRIYAMRAKGFLYELTLDQALQQSVKAKEINLNLPANTNLEGITALEPNILILADKGDKDSINARNIYRYDLSTSELSTWLSITPDMFAAWILKATNANGKPLKQKENGEFKFAPSGLAVHPVSGDVYVLSSVGKWLLIFDKDKGFKSLSKLDKTVFVQPEGIDFDGDGRLWISTEGKEGKPAMIIRQD
jgi:uncharacterized protein YjiK